MILRSTIAAAATAGCLLAAACAGSTGPAADHDHGRVVARLPIPVPRLRVVRQPEIVNVTVTAGHRFSIKVDTSDGPIYWSQVGRQPNPHLVKLVGDFDEGHCAADLVGCRVPYFHTLLAVGRGTTTMAWRYHDVGCTVRRRSSGKAGASCTRLSTVIFAITVR